MELHPALEDIRRTKDHADRRGQNCGTPEYVVDNGPVPVDCRRIGLVEGKVSLFRDDRAEIPKRNEGRAGIRCLSARGSRGRIVMRFGQGNPVQAERHWQRFRCGEWVQAASKMHGKHAFMPVGRQVAKLCATSQIAVGIEVQ